MKIDYEEIFEWPLAWASEKKDLDRGRFVLEFMLPFIEHMEQSKIPAKAIKAHLVNLWQMGGHVVKDLRNCEDPDGMDFVESLCSVIDDGESGAWLNEFPDHVQEEIAETFSIFTAFIFGNFIDAISQDPEMLKEFEAIAGIKHKKPGKITKAKNPKLIQMKISLDDIKPVISRKFLVDDSITVHKLHGIIQTVMGWENYHLYSFDIGGERYSLPDPDFDDDGINNSKKIKLSDLALTPKQKIEYTYDFGDDWIR